MRTCVYNYVRTYVAYTRTYMYVSICDYKHTLRAGVVSTPALKNKLRHSHIHVYISRVIHMYIHTNKCTYIQIYIDTHLHYILSMIAQVIFVQ